MAQSHPPPSPIVPVSLSTMPPKKTPSRSQASKPEPDIPGGGFIRAPCSKAKVPLKARCVHLPQDIPSPLPSFFDLMPQLSVNIAPTDAAAGLSSQVHTIILF
jgi:hypothetical protein